MSSFEDDVAAVLGLQPEAKTASAKKSPLLGRVALVGGGLLVAGGLGFFVRLPPPIKQDKTVIIHSSSRASRLATPLTMKPNAARIPSPTTVSPTAGVAEPSSEPSAEALDERTPPPPPGPNAATLRALRREAGTPPVKLAQAARERLAAANIDHLGTSDVPVLFQEPAVVRAAPEWTSEPSPEEVERAYPEAALRDGLSGSVVLSCLERVDGLVEACHVLEETPVGAGFGRAALHLSRRFRFTPRLFEGRPVEMQIEIPYDFSVTD